jgi:hypothetical protein
VPDPTPYRRPLSPARSLRAEFVEQRSCFFQIECVEAFGEASIDRRQQFAGLHATALVAAESGEADSRAQLPFAENPPGTEWLKTLPLGPEDTEKLLNGNARRLLKL